MERLNACYVCTIHHKEYKVYTLPLLMIDQTIIADALCPVKLFARVILYRAMASIALGERARRI
jgi:hypothetical protein